VRRGCVSRRARRLVGFRGDATHPPRLQSTEQQPPQRRAQTDETDSVSDRASGPGARRTHRLDSHEAARMQTRRSVLTQHWRALVSAALPARGVAAVSGPVELRSPPSCGPLGPCPRPASFCAPLLRSFRLPFRAPLLPAAVSDAVQRATQPTSHGATAARRTAGASSRLRRSSDLQRNQQQGKRRNTPLDVACQFTKLVALLSVNLC
jgi:hypothetical protein